MIPKFMPSVVPVLTSPLFNNPMFRLMLLFTYALADDFNLNDQEIKPVGWISLNINIGNIEHMMPKVGICAQLPFPLILGFHWQQVQARCTYDPNGSLCIVTPFSFHLYECIHLAKSSMNCLTTKKLSLPTLDDVVLPETRSISLSLQKQPVLKSEKLSAKQLTQLDVKAIPSLKTSCSPRRVVVNILGTFNAITKIDPHPIDQIESVVKRTAGKRYSSKIDVKSVFSTIHIRESDIYKTGFITPDGHFEFLRMPFDVTNGPSTTELCIYETHLVDKRGFDLHRISHSFKSGDFVLYD
ncbi:uncharacterized protein NPIL_601501 [Nephila pilipes]|uniref:Uncharacterized protein n=1 Tax=Nephila pilipes TaxID=299642 RepID=A0A8X6URZ8_NEPPI|nr:uncharacterized protein NPIL_601501 [Nephila pilipes]